MSFADDLLLFTRGDLESVQLGMENFQEFSRSTSLVVNPSKCNVYFGGVDDKIKEDIMMVSGFKEGDILLRYLGIPLTSMRLSNHQCVSLVENITSKIRHWSSHFFELCKKYATNKECDLCNN